MSNTKALPVVKPGEELEAWLARAVPALMETQGMDEAAAKDLATQAWNKVNGDGADAEDPEASAEGEDPEAALGDEEDPEAALGDEEDPAAAPGQKPPFGKKPAFGAEDDEEDPLATPAAPAAGVGTVKPGAAPAAGLNTPAAPVAPAPVKPMAQPMAGAFPPGQTPVAQPNGQQPGMDWNNSGSWGNGLDGNGGGNYQTEEESDGRRDPLALGPVEDAAQLLENWFVANVAAYASSLAATLMDTSRVSEEQGAALNKSIARLMDDLAGRAQKAATIGSYFEARIHQDFTNLADTLRGEGHLTREERIALSSCIGDALQAFNDAVASKLSPATQKRSPWADVEPVNTTGDQFEFLSPLPDFALRQQGRGKTVKAKLPAQLRSREDDAARDAWAALHGVDGPTPIKAATLARPDPEWMTIKSVGKNRVGSYLCLWGDPNHRDISGEWFSPRTEELTGIFDAVGKVPAIYHHAMDGAMKSLVIGTVDTMEKDDVGLWIEAQIQRHAEYQKFIAPLIDRKVLGWSSGTLPMARQVNKSTGEIMRWPIVEASMTPQPAEMRMAWQWPVKNLKAAYLKAGLPTGLIDQMVGTQKSARQRRDIELELEKIALLGLAV